MKRRLRVRSRIIDIPTNINDDDEKKEHDEIDDIDDEKNEHDDKTLMNGILTDLQNAMLKTKKLFQSHQQLMDENQQKNNQITEKNNQINFLLNKLTLEIARNKLTMENETMNAEFDMLAISRNNYFKRTSIWYDIYEDENDEEEEDDDDDDDEEKIGTKASLKKNIHKQIPEDFLCPITFGIMTDPVFCSDGHTYERKAIEDWLNDNNTSPKTNMPLEDNKLIPNRALKNLIQDWIQQNKYIENEKNDMKNDKDK